MNANCRPPPTRMRERLPWMALERYQSTILFDSSNILVSWSTAVLINMNAYSSVRTMECSCMAETALYSAWHVSFCEQMDEILDLNSPEFLQRKAEILSKELAETQQKLAALEVTLFFVVAPWQYRICIPWKKGAVNVIFRCSSLRSMLSDSALFPLELLSMLPNPRAHKNKACWKIPCWFQAIFQADLAPLNDLVAKKLLVKPSAVELKDSYFRLAADMENFRRFVKHILQNKFWTVSFWCECTIALLVSIIILASRFFLYAGGPPQMLPTQRMPRSQAYSRYVFLYEHTCLSCWVSSWCIHMCIHVFDQVP